MKFSVRLEVLPKERLLQLNDVVNELLTVRNSIIANDNEMVDFYQKQIDLMEKIIYEN